MAARARGKREADHCHAACRATRSLSCLVLALCEQGLTSQEIAVRLGMKARTVRDWRNIGVAPESRPRRKYRSEFDPYAPYVLKRGPRRRAQWPPALAGSQVPGV